MTEGELQVDRKALKAMLVEQGMTEARPPATSRCALESRFKPWFTVHVSDAAATPRRTSCDSATRVRSSDLPVHVLRRSADEGRRQRCRL
jgi:hypothetical protein